MRSDILTQTWQQKSTTIWMVNSVQVCG